FNIDSRGNDEIYVLISDVGCVKDGLEKGILKNRAQGSFHRIGTDSSHQSLLTNRQECKDSVSCRRNFNTSWIQSMLV
ncbi:5139_t:CDS:1, partial [Gigaspora rosea]